MKVATVCARCNKKMEESRQNAEITQGICADCAGIPVSYDSQPFQDFLDKLMVPVMTVNDQGVVIAANKTAQTKLNKDLAEIRGFQGGNVMECAFASLPEGCGRTVHCNGCTIRKTVMATHEDGISRNRVEALQEFKGDDGSYSMQMLISTEKIDNVVLLRIDGINPTELIY